MHHVSFSRCQRPRDPPPTIRRQPSRRLIGISTFDRMNILLQMGLQVLDPEGDTDGGSIRRHFEGSRKGSHFC